MNKKKLKTWHNIYEASLAISDLEPWRTITEKDVFFYCTEDGKSMRFFKIIGHNSEYCGIAVYTNPMDFFDANHFATYGNSKGEPALYMQNAIIGFWDAEEAVSEKNKEIIKALPIICEGEYSWLHFEKYKERLFPEDLSDSDTELLADALGNLFMMLKAVLIDKLQIDFKNGDALMRRYAGNGIWHNIPIDWKSFSAELSLQATIGNKSILKSIRNTPVNNLTLEVDARCLADPVYDNATDTEFFPMIYTIIDAKSNYIIDSAILDYRKILVNELLNAIVTICFDIGRPKKIIINDNRINVALSFFCKETGIMLEFTKKPLKNTEEAIKDFFKFMNEKDLSFDSEDFEDDDDCDTIDLSEYEDHFNSPSYVISVSLFTGCYRHIIISGASTLEELHFAILEAFEFDDDHAHVFFMNNKIWTPGGYYSKHIEDENKHTDKYRIKDVLHDKQQFTYVFDFGEEWTFKCKVLRIDDEPTVEASVIRSKGEPPNQYRYNDDEDFFDISISNNPIDFS